MRYVIPSVVGLETWVAPLDVVSSMTKAFCRRHTVVPLRVSDGALIVAMADPESQAVIEEMKILTKRDVKSVRGSADEISRAMIARYYGACD